MVSRHRTKHSRSKHSRRFKHTRRRPVQKGGMTPYATQSEEMSAMSDWLQSLNLGSLTPLELSERLLNIILRSSFTLRYASIRHVLRDRILQIQGILQGHNAPQLNFMVDQAIKHINKFDPAVAPVAP